MTARRSGLLRAAVAARGIAVASGWAALVGCGPGPSSAPPAGSVQEPGTAPTPAAAGAAAAEDAPAEPPRFRFVDVTETSGLAAFRQVNGSAEKPYIVESVGGGVAFLDADGDGRLDVYLANGGRLAEGDAVEDALFRNTGERFVDATASFGLGHAGWSNGVRAVDVDGDGWSDLYLTVWGPNALLMNRAGERFEDVTVQAGVGDPRWSTGAAFLDHDRDGDLDLYVANYVDFALESASPPARQYKGLSVFVGPRGLPGARDTFYVNAGDGTFRDGTQASGVADSDGFAFQCVVFDADQDGWVDIYVANDSTPNRLWRNRGDGTFEDRATRVGLSHGKSGKAQAGMGVALGDVDGDGAFDLFVTNFSEDYYTLYQGLGRGLYADVSMRFGVAMPTWDRLGWGCGLVDLDNDSDLDLYCVNGHVFPQVDRFASGTRYRQRNQVFENAEPGRFVDVSERAGPGLGIEAASRGAAHGDYDNDGDLDLLIGNLDGAPTLLRNDGDPGHWLKLSLVATAGHRAAIGATVELTAGGSLQRHAVGAGSGFLSENDARLHVGLGTSETAQGVRVQWPGRAVESFGELAAGALYELVEGAGKPVVIPLVR